MLHWKRRVGLLAVVIATCAAMSGCLLNAVFGVWTSKLMPPSAAHALVVVGLGLERAWLCTLRSMYRRTLMSTAGSMAMRHFEVQLSETAASRRQAASYDLAITYSSSAVRADP
jgi:hypothetical protein